MCVWTNPEWVPGREESGGAGADQRAAGARQVHHGPLQVSQENRPRRLAAQGKSFRFSNCI